MTPDINKVVTRGVRVKPPRILIYGSEGIGKSTFAAGFPGAVFIPTEDGLDNIDCASFPVAKKFDEIVAALDMLLTQKHEFKTVVIDSLDWAERLLWSKLCDDYKVKNIEKVEGGYGKGYVVALSYWSQVLERCARLRNERNMAIVFTAHASIETVTDPETNQFTRLAPRLHKRAYSLFAEFADAVLLGTREFGAAKGKDGGERVVKSQPSATQSAKCRYGLPETLPLDANAVLSAIAAYQNQLQHKE